MAALARMRTVQQIVAYFKNNDPDTVINENAIRRMIKNGDIPVFYAGRKALINLDQIIGYFNSELEDLEPLEEQKDKQLDSYGRIRKVDENPSKFY